MTEILNPLANHLRSQFKNIEHVVPAKVSYLTIFNPDLTDGSEDQLINQILCYVTIDDSIKVDDNTKLRQIGLIQGICNFAKEFSDNKEEEINHIDTEQTRIVIQKVENNFFIVACIELTKLRDNDNEQSDNDDDSVHLYERERNSTNDLNVEYSTTNLSHPTVLINDLLNAYNYFKLHYGTFESILQSFSSSNSCTKIFETWWLKFSKNWKLSLSNIGFLKNLNSYKLSSKSISYSNSPNIKNLNLITEKLSEFFQSNSSKLIDFLIFNPLDLKSLLKNDGDSSRNLVEEYGIIFKGFDIISNESFLDIYTWLEETNFVGINSNNLLMDNYPQEVVNNNNENPLFDFSNNLENNIFNPFTMTIDKVTNFFSTFDILNNPEIVDSNRQESDSPIKNLSDLLKQISNNKEQLRGDYLIGMCDKLDSTNPTPTTSPNPNKILNSPLNNKDISKKKLFIKLNNENNYSECNAIVYNIGGLLFVLFFENDYNDLDNFAFYEQLEDNIVDLFESISEFFYNNSIQKKINQKNSQKNEVKKSNYDYLSLKNFSLPFGIYNNNNNTNQDKKTTNESLRNYIEEDELKLEKYKSSFYYIVYIPELNYYQTSLPIILNKKSFINENLEDSSEFLDPSFTYDLLISKIQSIHLHEELILQFNFIKNNQIVFEKMINTNKFWWIYFNKNYQKNNQEKMVFILKKFKKNKNLLFNDKNNDFLSMLGDNVKIWFDNCISTGRV